MKDRWVDFNIRMGPLQPLPPERRCVLVAFPENDAEGRAPIVAVGYLRYSAGDKNCPYFVTPGVGGNPTHWNDCLGDDFEIPVWAENARFPNRKAPPHDH